MKHPREWTDLSDGELRARLKQRGVDPYSVAVFIHYREQEHFAVQIDQVLA